MNTPRHPRRANTGFTLVEVLIALAILVIGIVAIMQLFPTSLLQARKAAERTVTAELANSVMSQIRASNAEAVFHGRIPHTLLGSNIYGAIAGGGLYDGYATTIIRVNGASDTYLQQVTFTVTFPDGRTEQYVTHVARQ